MTSDPRLRLAHLREQLEALMAYGNGATGRAQTVRGEIAEIEAGLRAADKPSPRPRRGRRTRSEEDR
jgi:hypothetical protein